MQDSSFRYVGFELEDLLTLNASWTRTSTYTVRAGSMGRYIGDDMEQAAQYKCFTLDAESTPLS